MLQIPSGNHIVYVCSRKNPVGTGKTGGQDLKIKFNFQSILRNREEKKTNSYKLIKIGLPESRQ